MKTDKAIETVNLTKSFPADLGLRQLFLRSKNRGKATVAVDHVSLEIRTGECFGLLGPNGAGKTTLIKMLCTLLPPDAGTARVNGFDIEKEQMSVKRCLGTLFSVGERGFFWRLSGFRNLEFYAAVYNVPRSLRNQRIKEVLEIVGLQDMASKSFQKYSGGMARRLALARALLPDPPILLLDEPTLELDVSSSRAIRGFIRDILCRTQRKTILYTTHNVEETSELCDRIAVINEGKIVACGSPNAIKRLAEKDGDLEIKVQYVTEGQIAKIRSMNCVLTLESKLADAREGIFNLRLRLDSLNSLSEVIGYLVKEKASIISIMHQKASIEDAFIQLTETGG